MNNDKLLNLDLNYLRKMFVYNPNDGLFTENQAKETCRILNAMEKAK